MHKGLASRKSGYFLQISGATAVSQDEIKNKRFGESTEKVFDDWSNVDKLKDEIKSHPNRTVDNYFLSLTKETPHVRSAIVFGPIIYGAGSGPVHQRSIQVPELCRIALERGRAVQVGKGLNRWGNVHVADIGEMFALLVRKAAEGSTEEEVWGAQGLYFAGAGKEIVRPHLNDIATSLYQLTFRAVLRRDLHPHRRRRSRRRPDRRQDRREPLRGRNRQALRTRVGDHGHECEGACGEGEEGAGLVASSSWA